MRLATKQAAAADQLKVLSSAPDDALPFGPRVIVHLPQLPRAERVNLHTAGQDEQGNSESRRFGDV